MTILARIQAHGGAVIRDQWRISIRKGRLTPPALDWLKANRDALMREVWPGFDAFEERAAIREFCGGQDRASAERDAYSEVAP